jgi:hypothetical protein
MANGQGGIAETMEFAAGEIHRMWAEAEEVDLTGLKCPMPALFTRRALRRSIEGALIAVTVTDALGNSEGVVNPTVSGTFSVVAPALMATE